jgi:hypothetical protein
VTHATQVQVIDIDSGSVVGTIPNKFRVHRVALASDLAHESQDKIRDVLSYPSWPDFDGTILERTPLRLVSVTAAAIGALAKAKAATAPFR